MWDYKSDACEALQNQHPTFLRAYIHLLYTTTRNQLHLWERLTPSPPGSVGSLPLWPHHRHLPALESRIEWSFLVVAFVTTFPQTIENRANKSCGLSELLPEILPAQWCHPRAWPSSWHGHTNKTSHHKLRQKMQKLESFLLRARKMGSMMTTDGLAMSEAYHFPSGNTHHVLP